MRSAFSLLCLLCIMLPCAGEEAPSDAAPGIAAAAARAIEIASQQPIFAKPFIISAAAAPGGVRVSFRVPESNVMVAPGQKKTRELFTVLVRESDAVVSAPEWRVAQGEAASGKRQEQLAKAAARATEHLYADGKRTSLDLELSVRHDDGKGEYSVLVQRIPYTPGAHTLVLLSDSLSVTRVIPGS